MGGGAAQGVEGSTQGKEENIIMCLAIPAKVVSIGEDDKAVAEIGGVRKEISLALVDGIVVGDYVIVHTGFALSKLDPKEAEETLELFAHMAEMGAFGPEAAAR
jgi:hydrogenase expression/formation protein HypC